MASNDAWKVLLQLELDKNSKASITDQLLSLQKSLNALDIKVDIDDKQLNDFKKKLDGLGKTTKLFDTTGGVNKLVKEVEKVEDSMGNVLKVTKEYDKKTGELSRSLEEVTNNYDKQNKYLNQSKDIYDDIEKSINKIYSADDKYNGFIDNKELIKIMDSFAEISIDTENMTTDLSKVKSTVLQLNKALDDTEKQAGKTANAIRMAQTKQGYDKQVRSDNVANDSVYTMSASAIDQQIAKQEQAGKMFSNQLKERMQLEYNLAAQMAKDVEKQISDQQKLEKQIREVNLAKKESMSKISNTMKSQDGYDVEESKRLVSALNKIDPAAEDAKLQVRELNAEVKQFDSIARSASSTSNSFSDSMKRWASFVGLYEMFQLGKRAVESMIGSVVTLDTELTNLQKVSDITKGQLGGFTEDMYNAAGNLGRTGTELITAVGNFAQAGYAIGGVSETLGKEAILMQNIGDGIDGIDQSTEVLISTMKAYNMTASESTKINDILNQVSNTSAVSFGKLADMIGRSSALMAQSGTSIEELSGMATAAFEIIQSSERVSTSLNTISLRIRALKTGVSEVDGEPIAKMGETLDKFGVKVIGANGELRDFYDIMQDLAVAYKDMSNADKQLVTQSIGGARNSAVLSALLTNWSASEGAITQALNSSGSALKENAIFVESLQGKLNALSSAWQQLATTSVNSDFVKSILEMTTGMIKFVDSCGGAIPLLTTILGLLVAIKAQSIGSFMVDGAVFLTKSLKDLYTAVTWVATGYTTLSGATTALGLSTATLATGGIGLLVVALGGLSMAMNAYKQHQEDLVANAKEQNSTIQQELIQTTDLSKKYSDLKNAKDLLVKSGKDDTEVRSQLLQVQKDIVSQLGAEVSSIDLVNGKYEENMAIIEKVIDRKNKLWEVNNKSILAGNERDISNLKNDGITSLEYVDPKIITDGLSTLPKELQKQVSMMVSETDFKIKISPEINNDDLYKVLDNIISTMELAGKTDNATYKAVLDYYESLGGLLEEQNTLLDERAKKVSGETIETLKISNGITDATKATKEQYDAMRESLGGVYTTSLSQLGGDTKKLEDNQRSLSVALGVLDEMFPQYSKKVDDTVLSTEDLASSSDLLNEQFKNFSSDIAMIDSAMGKIQSGTGLTSDEIIKLTEKFPQLQSQLKLTENGYTINESALKSLRGETVNYENQSITSQINATKQAIASSAQRIGVYSDEVLAISNLADAQNLLNGARSSAGNQQFGSYRPASYKEQFNSEEQQVVDKINNLKGLYEQLDKAKVVETGGIADNKVDKTKTKDKDNTKAIKDAFQAKTKAILSGSDEINRTIAKVQQQEEMYTLKGQEDLANKSKQQLIDLQKDRREIIEEQANALRSLMAQTNDVEIKANINSEIMKLQDSFHESKMTQYQDEISLIEKKSDIEKRAYDDKLKRLEIEQIGLKDDSPEYIAIEQKKVDMLLDLQNGYQDTIKQLKAKGYTDEQEIVRKYIDLYTDSYIERLNLEKAMLEKSRKLEIDAMNKKKDDINKAYDAKKQLLDITIAMLTKEGKVKEDAIKKEIDGFKKASDERKRLIEKERNDRKRDKEIESDNKEVSSIERELAKLQFDNSEWAIAEKLRLEEELAKKKSDIDDKNIDDAYDKQIDAIDEQLKLFEDQKNQELEIMQNTVNSESEIRKKAIDLINSKNKGLYNDLKRYNSEYAKMSEFEFEQMWTVASKGLEEYGIQSTGLLDTMYEMQKAMKDIADEAERLSKAPIVVDTKPQPGGDTGGNKPNGGLSQRGKEQLNQQKYLHSMALEAEKTNNEGLKKWIESERKKWGMDKYGKIITQFHTGLDMGQVGTGLKPDELIARLTDKEYVWTDMQMGNLTSNLKGLIGNKQSQLPPVNLIFNGTVTEGAKPMLKEFEKNIENTFYKLLNKTM